MSDLYRAARAQVRPGAWVVDQAAEAAIREDARLNMSGMEAVGEVLSAPETAVANLGADLANMGGAILGYDELIEKQTSVSSSGQFADAIAEWGTVFVPVAGWAGLSRRRYV